MPRLAWFSPLPPSRSGIAAYTAEVLPLLARRFEIEAFVDPRAPQSVDLPLPVFPSHAFMPRQRQQAYDLVVYQLGNGGCHDYMWPYFVRFPGLAVLHDGQLHHARAAALLGSGRRDEYRREFEFSHPDANPGLAEIVIAGRGGSLIFLWPLLGVPIESSRLVAVHSAWLAEHLRERYPRQAFVAIRMGVSDPVASPGGSDTPRAGLDIRRRHGIAADRLVFAAYGMLTPEKRLLEIFKGLGAILPYAPHAHLLLVGQPVDYYDVEADARTIGVERHVTVTGYVPDEELDAYLRAADVCMCLRWPTSRETSASWLRCLAAGKPTVITDLAHTTGVPALDPRSWTTLPGTGDADWTDEAPSAGARPATTPARAVCVAVDILDEQHSVGLAMRRLAMDEDLRRELGASARQYWSRNHTPERMAGDYERVIAAACERPAPDRSHVPAHLMDDGTGLTRDILDRFGLSLDGLGMGTRR